MASELHPWRFELEIFPSRLPCGHVLEPKLNAQQGAICEAFFWKCFEQSTSWCFGSHFFVARSCRFIAICHCRFLASFLFLLLLFLRKGMERKLLCQLFTATNCSTFARYALKLICHTTFDSTLFKSLLSHASQLSCVTSRRSRDRNPGFSAADDVAARSVVFVFIQINTFTYLRKMSSYQTNSVYVKLYLYTTM